MKKLLATLAVAGLAASASAQTFSGQSTPFDIPDDSAAGFTDSTGVVNGAQPVISTVSLSITFDPGHTWGGDILATLSYSEGGSVTFINRVGSTTAGGVGDSSDFAGTYTFEDGGANLWDAAIAAGADFAITPGVYQPQTRSATFAYEAASFNSAFAGLSSTGEWTLTISDNAGGDEGGVSAWSVTVTTVPAPSALALAGLGGLVAARRRRA